MGAERGDGWNVSFEIMWTNPDTRASYRTGVVHGGRAPRQEWSMGKEHQDRSGPWEENKRQEWFMGGVHQDRSGPWQESTKTGVVHGRRAPRQEWSMGGEHQDRSGPWKKSTKTVVQKADGQRVQFTAITAVFTITCWIVSSDTDSKEETVC